MKNQFRFSAPIVHTIEIQRRPTTFRVSFPDRNLVVSMIVRGTHVHISDAAIVDNGKGRRQLKWNGTVNKLFKAFPSSDGLQAAFRRYVKCWYCSEAEVVI